MRLSVKGLAVSAGILWGAAVFLVGLGNHIRPGYGRAFLNVMDSIYPGYHVGGLGNVFLGGLYGIVDGVIAGAVFAWLYNLAARSKRA